ncbi:hypothetical protein [Deinococcus sp. RM]|uniref:hypothetical protein n=1 Tax=Deinococcus sp. RM TaxID=2316359 RepID=UPI0013141FD1|nr:hypothetical protein [Deinococcus sp. RM]
MSTTKQAGNGQLQVRLNGLKHGVSARLMTETEQEAFDEHLCALKADLQPVGYLEGEIVLSIAYTLWRQRKLYAWQEFMTQSEMRQAVEAAAYPNPVELSIARLQTAQGQRPASTAACLLELSAAVADAGLIQMPASKVADFLPLVRGAAETMLLMPPPEGRSKTEMRLAQHTLLTWLDRVEGLLDETQARALVPGEAGLNLIMRYEGSLGRSLQRSLDQLRVLQARRTKFRTDEDEDDAD